MVLTSLQVMVLQSYSLLPDGATVPTCGATVLPDGATVTYLRGYSPYGCAYAYLTVLLQSLLMVATVPTGCVLQSYLMVLQSLPDGATVPTCDGATVPYSVEVLESLQSPTGDGATVLPDGATVPYHAVLAVAYLTVLQSHSPYLTVTTVPYLTVLQSPTLTVLRSLLTVLRSYLTVLQSHDLMCYGPT
ncbi:unnamed protein product [Boreogadus saida]